MVETTRSSSRSCCTCTGAKWRPCCSGAASSANSRRGRQRRTTSFPRFRTAAAGAYLSDSAVKEIFAGRMPIVAGQGIPNGRAVVVAGGYKVQGQWNYGSGVQHAGWIHTGALVYEAGGAPRLDAYGQPEVRI